MVDYYLYHELYDVTAHVVYVPHEKATITCTAPYTKLPKDLDLLVKDESYSYLVKSVVVDIVARTLMTSTDQEPMTQYSESALGYSVSVSPR